MPSFPLSYAAGPAAAFACPMPPTAPEPDTAMGCLHRGRAALHAGDIEGALAWFDRALLHAPGLPMAHWCRSMVLTSMGHETKAAEFSLEASYADPRDGFTHVQTARALLAAGDRPAALRALGTGLAASPHLAAGLLVDPGFAPLRDHPAFLQVLGAL